LNKPPKLRSEGEEGCRFVLMMLAPSTEFVKATIYHRPTIALVAKYVYDVLELFYALPVFRLKDASVVVLLVFGH
jgi:hypothetical protein